MAYVPPHQRNITGQVTAISQGSASAYYADQSTQQKMYFQTSCDSNGQNCTTQAFTQQEWDARNASIIQTQQAEDRQTQQFFSNIWNGFLHLWWLWLLIIVVLIIKSYIDHKQTERWLKENPIDIHHSPFSAFDTANVGEIYMNDPDKTNWPY